LSQKITHFKRLRNVDDEMTFFLETAGGLKQQLGAVLVQLPPNFKKDASLLGEFLARFAPGQRLAVEFRHESWFCDEIYELLRTHKSALAIVEAEKEGVEVPTEITAPFVYMRLRKGDYTPAEMDKWARWIRNSPVDVFCYLKHDERAPVLAGDL